MPWDSIWFGLLLVAAAAPISALLAYAIIWIGGAAWIAVPTAGLLPPAAILCVYLYLESLQPVGPYHALIGLTLGALAVPVGVAGAFAGLLRFRRQVGNG